MALKVLLNQKKTKNQIESFFQNQKMYNKINVGYGGPLFMSQMTIFVK